MIKQNMRIDTKKKLFQFLFIFLIITLILFLIWMFLWIQSISAKCIKDPLKFYAERMDQECGGKEMRYEISCVPTNLQNINWDVDLYYLDP